MEVTEKDGTIIFKVRVSPASKSRIIGEHDGAVKVRIASPPVDGAANDELKKLLANVFAVSRGDVEIIAGLTSKTKRVRIAGAAAETIGAILQSKS